MHVRTIFSQLAGSPTLPIAVDSDGGRHITSRSMTAFANKRVVRILAVPGTSAADLYLYTNHSYRIGAHI